MPAASPPPLPQPPRSQIGLGSKVLIGLALIHALFIGALIVLRVFGLIRPFSIPTGAMRPAVSAGDHIMMERISYLTREPRRGDIVVFKTDGIASLPAAEIYLKRVAGEPGEHVQITAGKLFVNEKQVSLSNAVGQIGYDPPPMPGSFAPQTDVTVPTGCYFVLGDNSTNSFDSRFWGSVPRANIIGRVSFCYWPPGRLGRVK